MINLPRICIQVRSMYIKTQSQPEDKYYIFAYTVIIRNLGKYCVQLKKRYWLITNAHGQKIEVVGEGVLGKKPLIPGGNEFQYTSGAAFETPLGIMQGCFTMIDHKKNNFQVMIPVFRLAIPFIIN